MNKVKKSIVISFFLVVFYAISPFITLKIMFINWGNNDISSTIFRIFHAPVLNMMDLSNPYRAYFIKYTQKQCEIHEVKCSAE